MIFYSTPLGLAVHLLIFCTASTLGGLIERTASTCGPTIITSARVITYEDFITVSHSCYSYTTFTPRSSNCVTYSCASHPNCVTSTTTTLYVPPADSCCAFTPTVTSQGPCSTCQTGCKTNVITKTITTTGGVPTPTLPSLTEITILPPTVTKVPSYHPRVAERASPCTTTVFVSDGWDLSPTRTMYLWTVTETATTNCHGCDSIVEKTLAGLGPGVKWTATYNNPNPTTTTQFACSST